MKKVFSAAAILLIAVLITAGLAACGSGKPAAGVYHLVEATGEGAEQYLNNKDNITLEVAENGKATVTAFGSGSAQIEFNADTGKVSIEGYEIPYTVKDDTITIEDTAGKLVFKK